MKNKRFRLVLIVSFIIWIAMASIISTSIDNMDIVTFIISMLLLLFAIPFSFYIGYKFRHRKYANIASNKDDKNKQDIDKMLG